MKTIATHGNAFDERRIYQQTAIPISLRSEVWCGIANVRTLQTRYRFGRSHKFCFCLKCSGETVEIDCKRLSDQSDKLKPVFFETNVDQLAVIKSLFKECLREVVREELSTAKDARAIEAEAPRDCMTKKQVAEYLQVDPQSITNWQNRSENPLPYVLVGADPRYYLADVQQWTRENKKRRRKNKSGQGEEKTVTNPVPARRMRPTLVAANKRKGGKHVHVQALERAHN